MSGIRTYEVEYLINASGNAATYFKTLAEGTTGMVEPLKQMEANIGKLSSTLKSFKQDETLKNLFTIKPTIDTSTFQTQLKSMQDAVKVAAEKMSMELNKALSSAASFKPIDFKKAIADSKKEMSARLTDIEKNWNKLAPGKDIRTIKSSRSVSSEAWKVRNQYKDIAKQLGVWGAKASKSAQQVIDSATTATQIGDKAKAIDALNKSLSNFTAGKSYKVKIDADISSAVAKINTLLNTIRESAAAIPVTLGGENKSTKGKSIAKTGKITKTGTKNVQAAASSDIMTSLLKGQEKAATLKINADISPALEQLSALLEKISASAAKIPVSIASAAKEKATKGKTTAAKEDLASKLLAGKKQSATLKIDADTAPALAKIAELIEKVQSSAATMPVTLSASSKTGKTKGDGTKTKTTTTDSALANIVKGKEQVLDIKAKFDGGQLVAQLTESIANLQNVAKERPVIIRGTFDGSEAGFQLNQSIANLQKLANSRPVVLNTTMSSTGAKTNDGTIPPAPVTSTKESGGTKQTSGGSASKGATSTQQNAFARWENSIKQSQLNNWASSLKREYAEQSRIHGERQAMYEKLWKPLTPGGIPNERVMSAIDRTNAQEIARLKAYNQAMQPQATAASPTMLATSAKASSFPRRAVIKAPKVPDPWYQFVGNTSFGARTPMAVDMAKGMGTMFAIGGAMSAVGNSLHQAMSYQNTMRTTQAIFKHGKTPYVDSDFVDMEQTARQIGKETKFTAPQVAQATKFLAMAGYNAKESKDAIKPIADIALIGDTDLGETADKLTNVMTTFGKSPKQMQDVADIMTTTFTRSNTDMMMLAESSKYAGGIANLYGGNFKNNFADVMAMFGIMGNAGIQASSAGTTLRMMYQNLMKPNKNQLATLKQYGIFTRDTNGQPLEMTDILMQIQKKVPQKQMADAIGNMFRITAQPGAAALATHIDDLIDLMQANRAAAGSGITEQIVDEKKNTIQGLWAQVQSTFTEGILQAFEGQEGGWAKQLADLRDYLARPETVDMLKSIVSLVETLANTLSWFAKVWANLYNMFPGIINGWMKVQLALTQIGYLITPFRQLYKVMQSLGAMMNGVAASTTTLTFAEQGIGRARQANAATNLVGGAAPIAGAVGARGAMVANASRGAVVSKVANNGLVAASLAAGMYPYKYRKAYDTLSYNPLLPMLNGTPMMLSPYRRGLDPNEVRKRISMSMADKEIAKIYGYNNKSLTKKQKRQLTNTYKKMAADIRAKTVYSGPLMMPSAAWPAGYGVRPIDKWEYGRKLITSSYYRPAVNQVLPINQYSGQTGAVLMGGQVIADRAASYRYRAHRWDRIARAAATGRIDAKWKQVAAMRAEQYTNAALLAAQQAQMQRLSDLRNTRRIRQLKNTALLSRYEARFGANEMTQNARASLAAQQAARRAARGPVAISTAARVARRGGWGAQAFAITNGFAAGMQAGSFGKLGFWGSLKSGFATLMGGMAKAIGMLVSPIGLAVSALTLLGAGIYKIYKDAKERQVQLNLIKQNANWADEHNRKIEQMYIETGTNVGGFKPVSVGYAKAIDKNESQSYAIDNDDIAKILLDKDSVGKLTGSQIIKGYVQKSNYLPKDLLTDYYKNNTDYKIYRNDIWSGKTINKDSQNNALKLGIIARWADLASEQDDVKQASYDLQKAIFDKDFKRAQDIINAYKPTSSQYMSQMTDANTISQISDPTKFYEWQYAQYKVLTDLQNNYMGPLKNYQKAMDMISDFKKMDRSARQSYDGKELVQTLIQSVPISFNGKQAQITLDKMGNIDWAALANSVKDGIPLSIAEQQEILQNTYNAILDDPNIKNFGAVIDLLDTYLPQIANKQDPVTKYYFTPWGEDDADTPKKDSVKIPNKDHSTGSDFLDSFQWGNNIKIPTLTNPWKEASKISNGSLMETYSLAQQIATGDYNQSSQTPKHNVATHGTNGGGSGKDYNKDYKNTYDRSAARPTQVIINIDKLANFDRTAITKNADDQAIINNIETKIAEAVAMLSAQALNSAGSLISQGV